jgi:aspartate aminotransferase
LGVNLVLNFFDAAGTLTHQETMTLLQSGTVDPTTGVVTAPSQNTATLDLDALSAEKVLGSAVCEIQAVMATAMKFAQARLSPPTFAQIASEAAIDTPASYFEAVIAEYKERRDVLIAGLQQIPGVTVATPKGAFYCIAALPVDNADSFAQWLLDTYDLSGETVMVAPAAGFYSTPGVGLQEVRIAYVLKKNDLIRAVEILKEAIAVYNAK